METPKWTVIANIPNEYEGGSFVGQSWEFYNTKLAAEKCYEHHKRINHVPTMRPYHHATDFKHLHVIDQQLIES